MSKTVLVLGATGMLGHECARHFYKRGYNVITAARDMKTLREFDPSMRTRQIEFDATKAQLDLSYLPEFFSRVGKVDRVINAIGRTIPFASLSFETYFINSALPHLLAKEYGDRLIHITTDCVFSGKVGAPYNEDSAPSLDTLYGVSKRLGEPRNCLTIRTSIIGRELKGFTGLLEWFLSAKGEVNGYTDHVWNGITTREFAKICDRLIQRDLRPVGIYHVFGEPVKKYDMLQEFKRRFKTDHKINAVMSPSTIDRRLSTLYHLNAWCRIPSFRKMLDEMPDKETI
jgi:dTDP-4-dehydrorhamnose reductase